MLTVGELLGRDGPFAHLIKDFAPRPQQQEMALAVSTALENGEALVTEAGTGTGKTFAYLVPALMSGNKVVISTATKTLQDQLFHRDIPVVRKALDLPVTTALLKGRANYLCLYRLSQAESSGLFPSRQAIDQLRRIRTWAGRTRSGDIAEVDTIPEDAPVWHQVTSTTDNCLGQECPSFSDCHVVKARRTAQEADIVVINHYLLFADMLLRDEGFGELLPGFNAIILDEAHQLYEIASDFFGIFLSSRQILEFARDVVAEQLSEAGDMKELAEAANSLDSLVRSLRLSLGNIDQRAAWRSVSSRHEVKECINALQQQFLVLQEYLEAAAGRSKGLDNCWKRSIELNERLKQFEDVENQQAINWYETSRHGFTLHQTPLDISSTFHDCMERYHGSWIFTSATLAIGNSFDHFIQRLGITNATTGYWQSPFNFSQNALLYLPKAMPLPGETGYTNAVVEAALPVVKASKGRTFILFTSHRALKQAADMFRETELDYPLLIQGSAPRSELLDRFRTLGNAILLGTNSFWEGVDVRGPALSCVIIDKLPFATPDDPVLQARADVLKQQGRNAFMDYLLPNAVIALKQGAGRLIRDINDRGVLMLCDPRIIAKSYGRVFLHNLPPMSLTRSGEDVKAFFEHENITDVQHIASI
jgi:ATP-dependent DNA helicase DinG